MAFELNSIVPWGRNLNEYSKMFMLEEFEPGAKIISFGDGPSSFNTEMHLKGEKVISLDPIYKFNTLQLRNRFDEVCSEVIEQTKLNFDNFVWNTIKNTEELQQLRMEAMNKFLFDFDKGLVEKRYFSHALPEKTKFANKHFDLALSSHFLFLYAGLGIDFHRLSILEMKRISREVRIFPLLDLNAQVPSFFNQILEILGQLYKLEIRTTNYEFQKGGNKMLVITDY